MSLPSCVLCGKPVNVVHTCKGESKMKAQEEVKHDVRKRLKKWLDDPSIIDGNIRLYNAAPETAAERDRLKEINAELLEALEWMLVDGTPGHKCGGHGGSSCSCLCARDKAKAAVAKAKWRQA